MSDKQPKRGDVEYLQIAAERVEDSLPDMHGFILVAFPTTNPGFVRYVSNIDRKAAITIMKTWIEHAEKNWGTHEKD